MGYACAMGAVICMFACLHVPDFAAQAALRLRPHLHEQAVAILDGEPPLEAVFAVNLRARNRGVARGIGRLQAESFPNLHLLRRSREQEAASFAALLECAAAFSPRIEAVGFVYTPEPAGTVVLDIRGTSSLFGAPQQLAASACGKAAACGLRVQAAVSANFHAAVCAARGCAGVTILPQGCEADTLGPLPLSILDFSPEIAETFRLWGIHTCAALSALPERDLIARLGQQGQRLRALARGEHPHLLVPIEQDFASQLFESIELDHPIEKLEPLQFLFARMIDQLLARVHSRSLSIAALDIQLSQETTDSSQPSIHRRAIRPALPTQDARTLLKLVQLDLETHPPQAAVIHIRMQVEAARPQVAQHGLYLPQSPEPGRLEILLARLRKLLGPDRVGTPQLLDTHRFESFRMAVFAPPFPNQQEGSNVRHATPTALRICRPPLAIGVTLRGREPVAVFVDGQRYGVVTHAGPWRTSGQWWSQDHWSREEWDVVLADANTSMISRIAQDPASNCWYMQGIYD
jgi:protein ImuB